MERNFNKCGSRLFVYYITDYVYRVFFCNKNWYEQIDRDRDNFFSKVRVHNFYI